MKRYLSVNRFNENQWTFIRGNEESTRELANIMAVKYKKSPHRILSLQYHHSIFKKEFFLFKKKDSMVITMPL
jgi:protein SCO1/2